MKSNLRLTILLAAAVLLVVLGGAVMFNAFNQTSLAAAKRQHAHLAIKSGNALLDQLTDAETGQRGFALTGNEVFLEPYLKVRDGIASQLAALRQMIQLPEAQKHVDALAPLVEAKLAEMAQVIELRRGQDEAAVRTRVGSGEGKRLMDAIRGNIGAVVQLEESELVRRDAGFQMDMRHLLVLMVAASLLALLFALAFAYLIYQKSQERLAALVHLETQHLLEIQEQTNTRLQQSNRTLREREEQLAVTLSSIGDAVLATDASACVTMLNPVAEHLTGWTQAQAVGRQVSEVFQIINKTTRVAATIPVMDALAHGTIQGLANHTVIIGRDGSECDIADSCAPIRDRDGEVVGAVLVFRNVTEEYAVQQSLRDSSELVQTILNTVVDGIITFHATGGIIETVNPAIELMFGYPAAQLRGQNLSRLIPELEANQSEGTCEQFATQLVTLASGLSREVVGRRQDGSRFALEISAREMWLGGQRYFTAILRDITARKQTEGALIKAGALQSAIFNSANFSSIATDAKGVIQIFNVGAERMLGYAAADVINRISPAEISDPQEVVARAAALSLELGTPITPGFEALVFKASRGIEDIYELTYIRKDGSRFPAVVSVTALRDDQKAIIGYLLIGTDNTARKQAEEALHQAGALQSAIFNSANFSSIATDANGVIQIFNVGAEKMLGYTAVEVMNRITPAEISDPQEVVARATALSVELGTPITPGFEALVFKASRGIEDIYELTYIRKDGSRFPAVVSVTALRDDQKAIIGYLLIGTDNTARKQAEEALHQAGALQSAIFNSANFSSIATDAKGVIQIFNVGAEKMLGYTAAEVMNRITPAEISDPQEVVARATELSVELGTPITPGFEALVFKASRGIEDIYELTYIRKDGSRFPAVVSVTALRDDQEEIIGYLLIGTDNTARKQVEAERQHLLDIQEATNKQLKLANLTLQISEEKFAVTINSIGDAVIATDAEARVTLLNPLAEQLTGWTQAQAAGRVVDEIFHIINKETRQLSTIPVVQTLATGTIHGLANHTVLIARNGSECDIADSCAPIRDRDGQVIGTVLVFRDVTGEYAVQKALRDQQFYTRSLIESNIDAIVTTDPAGTITDVNHQMEVLTGHSHDELVGMPFKNHFTDPAQAEAAIQRVLKESKVTDFELTVRAKDGQHTVVSYNATNFYDQDGILQGVFFAARDVTERKRVDQVLQENTVELEKAKALAEQANLAKSNFLSSMSHELRSPLNAILGFAQLMDSDTPPPTLSQKGSIDQILHAGWYLLELINEILDLAVVESGRLSLSLEAVSLPDVMLECQAMIEPQAQKRGISMTFPQFADPCYIKADHTRVKQVLINLLSNAIKYNQAGGSVSVDCDATTPGGIRISVKDTGAGLSPDKIAQLFQPFNRLGQETGGEEGTGIGLVVSKRLVELMHGMIGVESTMGVGSVFWIDLLAENDPHAKYITTVIQMMSDTPVVPGVRPHLLLYVEDNPANLKLVEQLIARRPDLRLLSAQNGLDGINLARTSLPDVILMDINLPGISGLEAMKLLRLDPLTAHIPIVALSANAMPRDIEKGLEAGFFRYLTKPIKVDQFMATLNEVIKSANSDSVSI